MHACVHNSMMGPAAMCHPMDFMQLSASQTPVQFYGYGSYDGILEVRKEKSRDAARSRRGKENYEFYELGKMLPLPAAISSQLDKASLVRLAISFLRLQDFSSHGTPPWQRNTIIASAKTAKVSPARRLELEAFDTHHGSHLLQSLDGFGFTLSADGRFLYISETVSIYLGLSQVEMMGSSVFDYIHRQDHGELAECLGIVAPLSAHQRGEVKVSIADDTSSSSSLTASPSTRPTPQRCDSVARSSGGRTSKEAVDDLSRRSFEPFCIRMKSTLTKRGVHVKSSGYRVVQINARRRYVGGGEGGGKGGCLGIVAVAIALPPLTMTELQLEPDSFITRLSSDLTVTYCEARVSELLELSSDDVTGYSLYTLCHAADVKQLRKAHTDLLTKGQVLTSYYRLLNRHGGYVWLQTCATVIYSSKTTSEQNIIAINYVISVEQSGSVMDSLQTTEGVDKRAVKSQRKFELNGGCPDDETGDNCEVLDTDAEDTGRRGPARLDRSRPTVAGDVTAPCKQPAGDEEKEEGVVCDSSSTTRANSRMSRRKVDKLTRRKRDRALATDELRQDAKVSRWPDDTAMQAGSSSGPPATLPLSSLATSSVSCLDASATSSSRESAKGASPTVGSCSSGGTPHHSPQDRPHDTPGGAKKIAGGQDNSSMFLMPHFGYPRRQDCLAGEGANSFVRDLEEVMNRHLPMQSTEMLRRSYTAAAAAVDCHKLPSPTSADAQAAHSSRESVICTNIYSPYIANVKDAHSSILPPNARPDSTAFYRSEAGHRQYKTPAHSQVGYAYTPHVTSSHVTDDVTVASAEAEQQLRWRYSERPLAAMWPLSAAGLPETPTPFFSPAYYGLNYTPLPSSYDDTSKTYW